MEVRTVPAGERELCAALGRIVVEAYRALPGSNHAPGYEASLADVAGRAAMGDTVVLGAFEPSDDPVGCVTYVASPASPMAELVGEGEAAFRMLGVDLAAQGRGAGRALVEACIERARSSGRSALVLHSTPWMVTAHGLYDRLGFERDPVRDWRPDPAVELLGFRLSLR